MNDAVIEVLIDKKVSAMVKFARVMLIVLTVMFVLASFFFGLIALIPSVAFGVCAYFVGLRTKVEYEYAYFDKELDVDVIYCMQKRKKVKSFDITKLEVLAPAKSYRLDEFKNRTVKTYDFSSCKEENQSNVYVMYVGGNDKVIFEPSEKMVQAIYNIAPRKVFKD